MTKTGRWGDLPARVASAVAMLIVGGGAIWLGGDVFDALVVVITGLMIWELARMTGPQAVPFVNVGYGAIGAVGLAAAVGQLREGGPGLLPLVLLAVPVLVLAFTPRQDKPRAPLYAVAIMLAGLGLTELRQDGLPGLIWLIAIVVASDVLGYFAGRLIGGPKFWPKVSPKKTWSGTVAGWIGAVAIGLIFMVQAGFPAITVLLAPFVALAAQMGDLVESAFKRRAGVKDSSHLIPGHGGFLDRFDGLLMAVAMLIVLHLLTGLRLGTIQI